MRGRVFLTAEYHRDTGARTDLEAREAAQHWTYRGDIGALSFISGQVGDHARRPIGHTAAITIRNATICSPVFTGEDAWKQETLGSEEPCSDVVLPWHSVRLIEVDQGEVLS